MFWYLSWGNSRALVIPEIYRTDATNARQWQQLSLYGAMSRTGPIYFYGTLTQNDACSEPWNAGQCGQGTPDATDNTPGAGWSQLWDTLNGDTRTAQQDIPWSTDISWKN